MSFTNILYSMKISKSMSAQFVVSMRSSFIILIMGAIAIASYAGGGWPQPKGMGYFKLSQWWIVADQHYTDAGLIDPNITNGLFNTSLYAEYGLTNRLTGVVYFPFFSRNVINNQVSGTTGEVIKNGEALNSIGDADLGIKYGLTKPASRIAVSATLRLGLPLGNSAGGSENNLQTGDGEFNQLFQIDAGTSFGSSEQPMYANLFVGINNRTNDFSDELRFGAEVGIGLAAKKLWLIARLAAIQSLKNGKLASEINSTSIFANNAEILSIGAEINYYISENLGISAGITAPIAGKIIFATPAYNVGVFYDM